MLNATELDSKFAHSMVDVMGLRNLKIIQEQVKNEVVEYERLETEMLFNITDTFIPKEDAEQKRINEKVFNDRQKFSIIMQVVSDQCGVSVERIKEHRRFREVIVPRWIVVFLTRWSTDLPMDDIARAVVNGERLDHSTISNSCAKITEAIMFRNEKIYPVLQKIVSALRSEGISINFKTEQPEWYKRLFHKISVENKVELMVG